jgi:hypothetical protein
LSPLSWPFTYSCHSLVYALNGPETDNLMKFLSGEYQVTSNGPVRDLYLLAHSCVQLLRFLQALIENRQVRNTPIRQINRLLQRNFAAAAFGRSAVSPMVHKNLANVCFVQ